MRLTEAELAARIATIIEQGQWRVAGAQREREPHAPLALPRRAVGVAARRCALDPCLVLTQRIDNLLRDDAEEYRAVPTRDEPGQDRARRVVVGRDVVGGNGDI